MASWLIAFVGCVYAAIAYDFFVNNNDIASGVVFAGYALATVGLYYIALR